MERKCENLTRGKPWAASRKPSPSAMFINGKFRSVLKQTWNKREREKRVLVEPVPPWLGFV